MHNYIRENDLLYFLALKKTGKGHVIGNFQVVKQVEQF